MKELMNEDEKKAIEESERKLYPIAYFINDLIEKLIKKMRHGKQEKR